MSDIDANIGRVWNPVVRPLVNEAWSSYNAGAIRSSIGATWTAITTDLIEKIVVLADAGDGDAGTFRKSIEAARAKGITADGVRAMQAIEASLLVKAEHFELFDTIGARELERIREDRNLCVHPSLRPLGEIYDPRPEVARAHLAVALDSVLVHPPTQGRKALEEFIAFVCDPLFSPSPSHLQATFFDRVRSATKRNIVQIAAKHSLCEVAVPPEFNISPETVADRMAEAIKAFAVRDRVLVRATMEGLAHRFRSLDGELQMRTLGRLGDQDFFWDLVDQPLADRLNDIVPSGDPHNALAPASAGVLALIRDKCAREHLPRLVSRFAHLDLWDRAQVAAVHPDPYFTPFIANLLAEAKSFRSAENATQTVALPHGPFLALQELQALLHAWFENYQCRGAAAMPGMAVDLLGATAHLGDARYPVFREFLDLVRTKEAKGTYYGYDDLEAALPPAG